MALPPVDVWRVDSTRLPPAVHHFVQPIRVFVQISGDSEGYAFMLLLPAHCHTRYNVVQHLPNICVTQGYAPWPIARVRCISAERRFFITILSAWAFIQLNRILSYSVQRCKTLFSLVFFGVNSQNPTTPSYPSFVLTTALAGEVFPFILSHSFRMSRIL